MPHSNRVLTRICWPRRAADPAHRGGSGAGCAQADGVAHEQLTTRPRKYLAV